jgi:cysteinyl-tRNA synthetase
MHSLRRTRDSRSENPTPPFLYSLSQFTNVEVYNSLSRKTEEFEPIEAGKVYMYVCGLTPYDHAHLGHARTYISMDTIKRYFIHKKFEVLHIQNITDIEDKIFNRSKETGKSPLFALTWSRMFLKLFSFAHFPFYGG